VLLHDAGRMKGAAENTRSALENICNRIIVEKKLPIVDLDLPQWSVWRRSTFTLWEKWDHLYERINNVEKINSTNIFRLTRKRYKGQNLYNENGSILAKSGDIVGEMHIDSNRLDQKARDVHKLAFGALRKTKESLPDFARYIVENPRYKDVEVFVGVTLINRGVKGLGFNFQDIPSSWVNRWIGFLQKLIMLIYHPMGIKRFQKLRVVQPKLVWISRQHLLKKWLVR
jgi:peptidoglycan-N-acetylglucosamine deacetylase